MEFFLPTSWDDGRLYDKVLSWRPCSASSSPRSVLSDGGWLAASVGLRLCQPCAAQSGRAQLVTCSAVAATLSQDLWLSSALQVCACRGASREPAVLPPPPPPPWCRSLLTSQHQSKISHWCLFSQRLPVSIAGFQWH